MGYSQENKMAAAQRIVSMHALNVAGNSCNLATESSKPLIHRLRYSNSLRKVNLMLKSGFIVLKLAKNFTLIYLSLESDLYVET